MPGSLDEELAFIEKDRQMLDNKRSTGSRYEQKAAAYLESKGLRILSANYRKKTGEIDLVARDQDVLVFVEVKQRKNASFGDPAEAVDFRKQSRIRRTAQWYLMEKGLPEQTACRFDVVSICQEETRWIRDAF